MMKVFEVIGNQQQQPAMQPTAVTQQARINKLVQQRVASQAQLPPTVDEKMVAMVQSADLKTRTDQAYAKSLRRQATAAERQLR